LFYHLLGLQSPKYWCLFVLRLHGKPKILTLKGTTNFVDISLVLSIVSNEFKTSLI
jgi:hypothetical protein